MIRFMCMLGISAAVGLVPRARGTDTRAVDSPASAALFAATCARCHPAERALGRRLPAAEWREIVLRMRGHAASGEEAFSAAAAEAIISHLAGGEAHGEEHEDGLTEAGKLLGVATGALVVCMIASGLSRRKLRRRFRPLHATIAVLMGLALLGHAAILYLHVGPPRSVWHLCGSAALLVILGTASGGLLRRKLGRNFLKLHMTGAFAALVLIVLHRVLA